MPTGSGCHMMRRTGFAPSVAEFACAAGEACPHIRIAERKDRTGLIDAFRDNELEIPVTILRDAEIRDRTEVRIELRQISAARQPWKTGTIFMVGF